jgi:GTPase SAR1 family protein
VNKRDNCEDQELRIHLKGNEKVGKTNLIKHWKNEEYKEYCPTESFSLRYLCIENNEKHYKLKLVWFTFFHSSVRPSGRLGKTTSKISILWELVS